MECFKDEDNKNDRDVYGLKGGKGIGANTELYIRELPNFALTFRDKAFTKMLEELGKCQNIATARSSSLQATLHCREETVTERTSHCCKADLDEKGTVYRFFPVPIRQWCRLIVRSSLKDSSLYGE